MSCARGGEIDLNSRSIESISQDAKPRHFHRMALSIRAPLHLDGVPITDSRGLRMYEVRAAVIVCLADGPMRFNCRTLGGTLRTLCTSWGSSTVS